MWDWLYDHGHYYQRALEHWWNTLGPVGYVSVLLFVGVFGFVAMKGRKRY